MSQMYENVPRAILSYEFTQFANKLKGWSFKNNFNRYVNHEIGKKIDFMQNLKSWLNWMKFGVKHLRRINFFALNASWNA